MTITGKLFKEEVYEVAAGNICYVIKNVIDIDDNKVFIGLVLPRLRAK